MSEPSMNCPFYGRHFYRAPSAESRPPFLLLDQHGNQCALITDRYAPCSMETDHQPVDWKQCPVVRDVRINWSGPT